MSHEPRIDPWPSCGSEAGHAALTEAAWQVPMTEARAATVFALAAQDAAATPRGTGTFAQPPVYGGKVYYSEREWALHTGGEGRA